MNVFPSQLGCREFLLGFLYRQYQSLSYWWLVGWWLAGRLLLTGALLTGNLLNGWMCQGSINPLVGARCGISLFGKCVLQSCPFSFPSSLTSASGHSLAQLIEQAQRTTADSHLSTMVQKTVVCRSNVVKHLHSGSFGEVYLGKWREDQVAIKIFSERHSDVWYKEVEVYQVSFHSTSCSLDVGMPYQCLAYLECHYLAVLFIVACYEIFQDLSIWAFVASFYADALTSTQALATLHRCWSEAKSHWPGVLAGHRVSWEGWPTQLPGGEFYHSVFCDTL